MVFQQKNNLIRKLVNLFFILLLIVLFTIAYQDLASRSIHWVTVPMLFISIICYLQFNIDVYSIFLNLLFLLFTLGTLVLYLRLRTGKFLDITKSHFGLGDILFLFALVPISAFNGFVVLFTMGTLFTLILGLILNQVSKSESIPYAGNFSIFLMVLLSIDKFLPTLTFTKFLLR